LKYLDTHVGEGYPDLVVHFDDKASVVVELKAVGSKMGAGEEQQLQNYMKILGAEFGLLINFNCRGRSQERQN
jgi:GxxExxY protein